MLQGRAGHGKDDEVVELGSGVGLLGTEPSRCSQSWLGLPAGLLPAGQTLRSAPELWSSIRFRGRPRCLAGDEVGEEGAQYMGLRAWSLEQFKWETSHSPGLPAGVGGACACRVC